MEFLAAGVCSAGVDGVGGRSRETAAAEQSHHIAAIASRHLIGENRVARSVGDVDEFTRNLRAIDNAALGARRCCGGACSAAGADESATGDGEIVIVAVEALLGGVAAR